MGLADYVNGMAGIPGMGCACEDAKRGMAGVGMGGWFAIGNGKAQNSDNGVIGEIVYNSSAYPIGAGVPNESVAVSGGVDAPSVGYFGSSSGQDAATPATGPGSISTASYVPVDANMSIQVPGTSPWVSNGDGTATNTTNGVIGTFGGRFAKGELVPNFAITVKEETSIASDIGSFLKALAPVPGTVLKTVQGDPYLDALARGGISKATGLQIQGAQYTKSQQSSGTSTGTYIAIGAVVLVGVGLALSMGGRSSAPASSGPIIVRANRSRRRLSRSR